MAGTLHVDFGSGNGASWSCAVQHENGQTFYSQFQKIKSGFLKADRWYAEFSGIPSGNYIVQMYVGSAPDHKGTWKKLITVMEGQETTIRF